MRISPFVIALLMGAVFVVAACQKNRNAVAHLPEEALAVATIQTSSLAAKLLVDKVGDYDLEESLMKLKKGIQTGKEAREAMHHLLENPAEFGLDLFTEAYMHISQSQAGKELYAALYLNVNNVDKLNHYLFDKFSQVIDITFENQGDFMLGKLGKSEMVLAWNDYLLVLLMPIGPAEKVQPIMELDYLFGLNNSPTLPGHHLYLDQQNRNDIAFSINTQQLQHTFNNSEKFLYFVDDFKFLNTYFNFHKGYLELKMEGEVKPELQNAYAEALNGNGFKEQFPGFDEERLAAFLNLQYNPTVINKLIKEFKYRVGLKMALLPTSFDEDAFYDLFQGSAFMLMYEGKEGPQWQLRLKTNDRMPKLLEEFHDFGILEKDKAYFRIVNDRLRSTYLWTERNWMLAGNAPDVGRTAQIAQAGPLYQLSSQFPASGFLRFDRLDAHQKEWLLKKKPTALKEVIESFHSVQFSVSPLQGNSLQANFELHFENNTISSFAELVHIISLIQRLDEEAIEQ